MDCITISKENLYTYSAKMRRSYEQDIARRAVEMFKRGLHPQNNNAHS